MKKSDGIYLLKKMKNLKKGDELELRFFERGTYIKNNIKSKDVALLLPCDVLSFNNSLSKKEVFVILRMCFMLEKPVHPVDISPVDILFFKSSVSILKIYLL